MSDGGLCGYDYVPVREDLSSQIAMAPADTDPKPALAHAEATLQAAGWEVRVAAGTDPRIP